MSQDAYSPITGRWGIEGIWDVTFVGLGIAGLALLILILASSRGERVLALVAALMLLPAYFGIGWLGAVQVTDRHGDAIDCLMQGPVDTGTDCGAAYVARYAALTPPMALLLVALVLVAAFQVRARFRDTSLRPAWRMRRSLTK